MQISMNIDAKETKELLEDITVEKERLENLEKQAVQ